MSIRKYTLKYLMISGYALLVIFAIGSVVFSQRQKKEAGSVVLPDSTVVRPVLTPRVKQSTGVGHIHADGTRHTDSPIVAMKNDAPVAKKAVKPTFGTRQSKRTNRSSFGWITWKYSNASGGRSDAYVPDFLELSAEIRESVHLLRMEQRGREYLQNEALENDEFLTNKVRFYDTVDFVGDSYNLPDAQSLLLDKEGNPLPPMTDAEYAEEELRRLVGDRDLEEAAQFLEAHGHHNELLLSRLDDEKAFDYLYAIGSPVSSKQLERTRVYAERVVASDPNHLEARLYLADMDSRSARSNAQREMVLAQYELILADHPGSAHALIEAADVLVALDRPIQAVEFFNRGHELGASLGFFEAGLAYQKLGDYKTAWIYMKKAARLPFGHSPRGPLGHLRAIESGDPFVKPLSFEKLDIPQTGSLLPDPAPMPESSFSVPMSEFSFPDPSVDNGITTAPPSDIVSDRTDTRGALDPREEIRQIMEQMSQKEINAFIKWAEDLEREGNTKNTTDFLKKELASHLSGAPAQFNPARIVRANELLKRFGPEEGLQRLKASDPEIALQVELLRKETPKPAIKD